MGKHMQKLKERDDQIRSLEDDLALSRQTEYDNTRNQSYLKQLEQHKGIIAKQADQLEELNRKHIGRGHAMEELLIEHNQLEEKNQILKKAEQELQEKEKRLEREMTALVEDNENANTVIRDV